MLVDRTDFKINQPQNFGKKWFSHKFREPGLRYKVALNIQIGNIVWSHGLFLTGAYKDLAIFLHVHAHKLKPGERVEADKGYRGWPRFVSEHKCWIRDPTASYQGKCELKAKVVLW